MPLCRNSYRCVQAGTYQCSLCTEHYCREHVRRRIFPAEAEDPTFLCDDCVWKTSSRWRRKSRYALAVRKIFGASVVAAFLAVIISIIVGDPWVAASSCLFLAAGPIA